MCSQTAWVASLTSACSVSYTKFRTGPESKIWRPTAESWPRGRRRSSANLLQSLAPATLASLGDVATRRDLRRGELRSLPALRRFKIVIVTDRKDLERQLSATAELTGETVRRARRVREVKTELRKKGPAVVFAMIQKMVRVR